MIAAEANSVLQPKLITWLSLLSVQTSGVRGFGQHGVGGTNPAEPLWAVNTHQHMKCTSLSSTEYTCCPITQMGLQQWKSLLSKALVYFCLAS